MAAAEQMDIVQSKSRSLVQQSQHSEQLQRTASLTDTANNKAMSRDSSAQLDKDQINHNKAKRIKKSQALIQSKLASHCSSVSSSVQQMPVIKQHTASIGVEQNAAAASTVTTALRPREATNKSTNKQHKKIMQL